ncbi:MAG: hypothetical protein ACFFCW_35195 [Candidatus Hodarchaeota archaeon]
MKLIVHDEKLKEQMVEKYHQADEKVHAIHIGEHEVEEVFIKFVDLQKSAGQARMVVARKPIVAERGAKFRYLLDDFAKLESDLSLNRLYSNGRLNVYYVHAVESSQGKRCKPLGDDE